MWGYLRRKVTYNLGTVGGIGSDSSTARSTNKRNGVQLSVNPFKLLNAGIDDILDESCVIVDGYGRYPIDNDYRDMGVREGWLIKTGYYLSEKGLVWTYIHKTE